MSTTGSGQEEARPNTPSDLQEIDGRLPEQRRTRGVAEHTREALGALSTGERKVGRALLAAYPIAGLETVSELAKRAGVSAPTVLRFTARIGFSSYPAFQEALHHEVQRLMAEAPRTDADREDLGSAHQHFRASLTASFESLPNAELDRATGLLADRRCRVHLLGGRRGEALAIHSRDQLSRLRADVRLLAEHEPHRASVLFDLCRRDVLVAFDFRDYDTATVTFARAAKHRGAAVILCTDPWMSPAADVADAVLPARIEGLASADSFVSAFALTELLAAEVAGRIGAPARERARGIEALGGPR